MKKYLALGLTLAASLLSLSCNSNSGNVVMIDDDETVAESNAPSGATLDPIPPVVAAEATPAPNADLETLCDVVETRDLFNGSDLTGWTNESGGEPKGWIAENGVLKLVDPANGGDIITKDRFTNYAFSFEWRFGRECNSGVKYKIEQPNGKGWLGLEYQVQDDANVEDGKVADRRIASLFDVLPAEESTIADQCPAPTDAEPSGEFRRGKIVVVGNRVEHWLDDQRVLAFTIGSDEWNAAKNDSKFKNAKNFGVVESSPLLLQAHGYPVEFRNLTVQVLEPKK